MKKYVVLIASVLLLLLNCLSVAAVEPQVVRVGAFNYYPAIFRDTDGVVKGFYVDALADVARRENIRFEYVYGSWNEGLERLKSGEVDLLTSVAFTAERAGFLDFAKTPLLTVWGELYVPLKSEIDGISTVQGKRVAVVKNDFNARNFIELVKKFDISCEFVEMSGFDDVFRAVAAKEVDAGVASSTFGVAKQREYGLRSTGIVFNPFDIFFAVAKGQNGQLLQLLENYLNNWRHQADSPYSKARQKWSHGSNGTIYAIPRTIIVSLALLAALALCSVAFIVVLRGQVRKKTRSAIESAEQYQAISERHKALLAAIPDIIMEVDNNKVYTWANDAGLEFFGSDVIGKEAGFYFAAGQNTYSTVLPLFKGDESVLYVESWQRRSDGEVRLLAWWCKALTNAQGTVTGTLSSARDITELKRVEESLRESNAYLENLINYANAPIIVWNPGFRITRFNHAFEALTGRREAEVLGQSLEILFPAELIESSMALIRKTSSGERWEAVEIMIVHTDGSVRTVLWNSATLFAADGITPVATIAQGQDITERKRVEEALQKNLLALTQPLDSPEGIKFSDLFNIDEIQKIQDAFANATGVASIITTTDGVPLTNPSNFCRFCSEVIRKTDIGLANCMKSDCELGKFNPTAPIIQPCLSGGLWDSGTSISVGGRHVANWLIGQVRNEEQDEERMLEYADEIGVDRELFRAALAEVPVMEKAQFEKVSLALFAFANELSQKAYQNVQQARFIADRKKIEAELQLKNAEMERFTYTVSHDLKSPLITIQSYAGMIAKDMEAGKQSRVTDDLKRIASAADKMTALINDLLELSRAGKVISQPAPVDMNRLVKDVLLQLAGPVSQHNIAVVVQHDLPHVQGDRKRIAEVVQNLVENAIKYMGDQAAPHIEIGSRQEGNRQLFFVRDNGRGIDSKYHESIFGLFNKLDAKAGGTGIGLSLVKRIVEAHGGRVWVESAGVGKGSCFCFTLEQKQ